MRKVVIIIRCEGNKGSEGRLKPRRMAALNFQTASRQNNKGNGFPEE